MALTGDELISVETALGYPVAVSISDIKTLTDWDSCEVTLISPLVSARLSVADLKIGHLTAEYSVPQVDARDSALSGGDLGAYFAQTFAGAGAVAAVASSGGHCTTIAAAAGSADGVASVG